MLSPREKIKLRVAKKNEQFEKEDIIIANSYVLFLYQALFLSSVVGVWGLGVGGCKLI